VTSVLLWEYSILVNFVLMMVGVIVLICMCGVSLIVSVLVSEMMVVLVVL